MLNVLDFIKWALTHAEKDSIVKSANLPISAAECGVEPWHYLYGTVRRLTTRDALDERYENYYKKHGYTRAQYDKLIAGWKPTDYATDCQGLLDAYLTYECGESTDWNADMNYKYMCEDKGEVGKLDRPYVVGEAVFMQSSSTGNMTHIGWICGFVTGGEPLVVEARGIAYGVVVTKFSSRPWTHRGLMTKKFDYPEPSFEKPRFEVSSPMLTGMFVQKMQDALNAAGYTDKSGNSLDVDGKWGAKSQQAFEELIADYVSADEGVCAEPVISFASEDGKYAAYVFNSEDLPRSK